MSGTSRGPATKFLFGRVRSIVGSNPRRGAKFPFRVLSLPSPFPFYNFPGSSGAGFRTVRTGPSAKCHPSRRPSLRPSGAIAVARPRVAAGTTGSTDSSGAACRWPDQPALPRLFSMSWILRGNGTSCMSPLAVTNVIASNDTTDTLRHRSASRRRAAGRIRCRSPA